MLRVLLLRSKMFKSGLSHEREVSDRRPKHEVLHNLVVHVSVFVNDLFETST